MREFSYGIIPYLISDSGISILLSRTSLKNNNYDFIKGKIETGELIVDCVVREVKEEIGIDINPSHLEDYYYQQNKRKDIGLFLINWDKYIMLPFVLEPKEIAEVDWFNIGSLPEVSNNQRLIITELLQKFNKLNSQRLFK
jgi:NADH pyrophosphatase NudC (nudix superfamily)